MMKYAAMPETYQRLYENLTRGHELWNSIASASGEFYSWPKSTYIAEPPFFGDFTCDRARSVVL